MARRFRPERLRHILEAITDIETLTCGKALDDYLKDQFLRLTVERCLEIVSEASRFIPEELRSNYPSLHWRGIADFGNILRHGYDSIDDKRIWTIVEQDLAPLKVAVEEMLKRTPL